MTRQNYGLIRQDKQLGMDGFCNFRKGAAGKVSPSDGGPKQRIAAEQDLFLRQEDAHSSLGVTGRFQKFQFHGSDDQFFPVPDADIRRDGDGCSQRLHGQILPRITQKVSLLFAGQDLRMGIQLLQPRDTADVIAVTVCQNDIVHRQSLLFHRSCQLRLKPAGIHDECPLRIVVDQIAVHLQRSAEIMFDVHGILLLLSSKMFFHCPAGWSRARRYGF